MIENPCIYLIPPKTPTHQKIIANNQCPPGCSELVLCELKAPKAEDQQVVEVDIFCHSPNGPCSSEVIEEIIVRASIETDDYIASYKLKKLLEKNCKAFRQRKSVRAFGSGSVNEV